MSSDQEEETNKLNQGHERQIHNSHRHRHPIEDVSFFSRCTFSYIFPLLQIGLKRPIVDSDLPDLHRLETSEYNRHLIESIWESECKQHNSLQIDNSEGEHDGVINDANPNSIHNDNSIPKVKQRKDTLFKALFWYYIKSTWWAQCLMAINMIARISQAIVLGLLMEQFRRYETSNNNDDDETIERTDDSSDELSRKKNIRIMYIYAVLLVVCGFIAFPTKQQQFFETYRKGVQLRIGLIATIYAKTLRLPSINYTCGKDGSINSAFASSGHVTNLVSNDVERFASAAVSLPFLIHGPTVAIVILIVGIMMIGPVFAVGYALLFFLMLLQVFLGRRFVHFRSQVASLTDKRVSLMSQAVSGVRVMKMNGWEIEFEKKIAILRAKEVSMLQKASTYRALNEALYYFSSPVISVFIFIVHVMSGSDLSPKIVYSTLTLMGIVQFILTKNLPTAVMHGAECYVACNRIQAFFELLDQSPPRREDKNIQQTDFREMLNSELIREVDTKVVLRLDNVTCFWNKGEKTSSFENETEEQTLIEKDASKTISIVALKNISLKFQSGKLYCIIGKVGCGKSALLQALAGELQISTGSLMSKFDSLSYACQEPWVMDGSVRENIIMGLAYDEEWYNQVVLACGLGPDIDAFTNGDLTIVGDRGLQCSGGQRSRIGLARALYRDADVCLLDDPLSAVDTKVARTIFYSAIQDLAVKRNKCVILVTHQLQFVGSAECILMKEGGEIECCGPFEDCIEVSGGEFSSELLSLEQDITTHELSCSVISKQTKASNDARSNVQSKSSHSAADQEEKRGTGIISMETWIAYGKALGGFAPCFLLFTTFAVAQAAILYMIICLGNWSEAPSTEQYSTYWFVLILSITGIVIFVSITRANLTFFKVIKTSQRLHDRMLHSVLRAKIQFFDTNPMGRILNRFSADTGILDEQFPFNIHDFTTGFFIVVGSIITSGIVLPFILVVIPPLLICFMHLRKIFVSTTRELKRLEGIARSPIYAMVSESLSGVATIRTNSKVGYFMDKFERVHNAHTRAHFAFILSSRWFAFKLDALSFILLSSASLLAVLFHDQGWFHIDSSILGLALTLLIQIATTNFPWVVRQSAEVCNQMVSVERILEYGSLPLESALETDFDRTLDSWPKNSSIKVQNLSSRYRAKLPLVLSNVSFQINAGERVGVVGRTASGKSTLVQTLFRLIEAEAGSIQVGDVDISNIGLHKLRTSMAVIPQSPVLFSGCTVHENLDPFGNCKREDVIDSLKAVQMYGAVDALPLGLETIVDEGGANFSVGQKQLLCLARAILTKSRILILDEPTANVDSNTDSLLQKTLRELFLGATIIMVAHRLQTVIDFDRILVLGSGKVLEYDTPKKLLARKDGVFTSMWNTSISNACNQTRMEQSFDTT